ncbi:unnamed protein product, partial [Scytosiphon promiscuus]
MTSSMSSDFVMDLIDEDESDGEQNHYREKGNQGYHEDDHTYDYQGSKAGEKEKKNASEESIDDILDSFRAEVKRGLMAKMSKTIDTVMDKAAKGASAKLIPLIDGLVADKEKLRGDLSKYLGLTGNATVKTPPHSKEADAAIVAAAGSTFTPAVVGQTAVTAANAATPVIPGTPGIADTTATPASPVAPSTPGTPALVATVATATVATP